MSSKAWKHGKAQTRWLEYAALSLIVTGLSHRAREKKKKRTNSNWDVARIGFTVLVPILVGLLWVETTKRKPRRVREDGKRKLGERLCLMGK